MLQNNLVGRKAKLKYENKIIEIVGIAVVGEHKVLRILTLDNDGNIETYKIDSMKVLKEG